MLYFALESYVDCPTPTPPKGHSAGLLTLAQGGLHRGEKKKKNAPFTQLRYVFNTYVIHHVQETIQKKLMGTIAVTLH